MNRTTRFFVAVAFSFTATLAAEGQWQTDYDKALATAKAEGKNVFINFTGSDWCGPCIAMHNRVFSQKQFLDYAAKHLILVEVDYPKRKTLPKQIQQQNVELKYEFHINRLGFPTIALVDSFGKVLGTSTGYNDETPAAIVARIEKWAKRPPDVF